MNLSEKQLAFVNAALRVCQARAVMATLLDGVLEPPSTGYRYSQASWAAQPYETAR